jgi:hypothetical protein
MSRTRLVIALLALAVVVAAAVSAGILGKGANGQASSPPCLPSTLDHSAKLAGLPVYVSPAPATGTASPYTQISFLGAPAGRIGEVSVIGERSGRHAGRLQDYSQGDGASFVPTRPFDAGERVVVHAAIAAGDAARRVVSFDFHVDTPYPTASVPDFPNPRASPADYQSFDTASGIQAPVLNVTTADRDPGAGDVFTTNGPGPGRYGAFIYTPQGRLVWFRQLSGGLSAENLSVQSYEGQPVLTFWQGRVPSLGFGQGEDLVMDSHYRVIAKVPGGNGLRADLHDFQIEPGHVSYTTAFNPIRCDLSAVGGARDGAILDNVVQEIDMKTGLVRWEWHSLDHVGVAESETGAPKGATPWDWFHINSIDRQPDGMVLISARSTWACYQLDGATGEVLWRLGGNKSSFEMGPGTRMAWQHDCRLLPDGTLTAFDDGSNPPVHHRSRALRMALDAKARRARLLAAYVHPSGLLSASQGNMQTLPDGNAVVGYGSVPEVSEYSGDGSLLFDAHLSLQMDSYRAFRFPWTGHPASPPAAAANLNSTGEETIVHASWNGATDVVFWRVLAGSVPTAMTAQTTVPASDFESSAILSSKQAYVALQALDKAGRVLGVSPPVRVASYAASLARSRLPG